MHIKLMELTITQGPYINAAGTSHAFWLDDGGDILHEGDISQLTRGYYQGNQHLIDAEIDDGWTLYRNALQTVSLANDQGESLTDDADYALEQGWVRRVAQGEGITELNDCYR